MELTQFIGMVWKEEVANADLEIWGQLLEEVMTLLCKGIGSAGQGWGWGTATQAEGTANNRPEPLKEGL